jgi:hypothetical protein
MSLTHFWAKDSITGKRALKKAFFTTSHSKKVIIKLIARLADICALKIQ